MAVKNRAIMYGFWASSCSWRVRAALHMKRIPFEERRVDIVKDMTQHTEEYRAINPSQKVPAVLIGTTRAKPQAVPNEQSCGHKLGIIIAHALSECQYNKNIFVDYRPGAFETVIKDSAKDNFVAIEPSSMFAVNKDGTTLVESMAIIQYLEDTRPQPPLMPKSALLRAQARVICETIVSGIQPLQNIGLKSHFETQDQFLKFAKHFTKEGLESLENFLGKSAGKYCVGDEITMADLCFVPQIYNCVTRYDTPGLFKTQEPNETPTQTWRQMIAEDFPTVSEVYDNLLKEEIFTETHPNKIKAKIFQ